MSLLLANFNVF